MQNHKNGILIMNLFPNSPAKLEFIQMFFLEAKKLLPKFGDDSLFIASL